MEKSPLGGGVRKGSERYESLKNVRRPKSFFNNSHENTLCLDEGINK